MRAWRASRPPVTEACPPHQAQHAPVGVEGTAGSRPCPGPGAGHPARAAGAGVPGSAGGPQNPWQAMRPEQEDLVMMGTDYVEYHCGKAMPHIFVGGVPLSCTTLMHMMLDAHLEVRCGEETRIIPQAMRQAWSKSRGEKLRLDEASITDQALEATMQAFILEVIAKHGRPAGILCNKDPFTLKSSVCLSRLFPNSKSLLMV